MRSTSIRKCGCIAGIDRVLEGEAPMKNMQSVIHPKLVAYFIELNKWLALLTLIGLLLTSVIDAIGVVIANAHTWEIPHELGRFIVRQIFRVVIFGGLYELGVLGLRSFFMGMSIDLKSKLGS